MRHGLSDDFLRIIFEYRSSQQVSMAITNVRKSLMENFVPQNIGLTAITRENYIRQHVTEFSNILYNPEPINPKAIAYIDGTYFSIEKSSNFRTLRHSFSVQKHKHLIKPTLIVAPDGYILDIINPYFSDGLNNDAAILNRELQREGNLLREWFEEDDIFVVDRGYRDSIPILQELGINHKMPSLLPHGQRQLTTEEANDSRLITKTRWIVESRNGHLKSVFKFLAQRISIVHASHLGDYLKIAGALLNRYHPSIDMVEANAELANNILMRRQQINHLQIRAEAENWHLRRAQWVPVNIADVPNFPHLQLNYLKDLTVGTYQIKLAPSYVQDSILQNPERNEFQLNTLVNEPSLLHLRIFSRFRNATRYQLWISFENNLENPISGYYCTCKSGARTLGSCAHVASFIWYMGYARHHEEVRYPSTALLEIVLDVANRNN